MVNIYILYMFLGEDTLFVLPKAVFLGLYFEYILSQKNFGVCGLSYSD